MKVTYLAHCGFMVETDDVVLVFDYLHDPSYAVKKALDRKPDIPVIFFISHMLVHNNHFNPGTFEIAQNHRRVYVVSNSVPAKIIPSTLEVAGMSKGDVLENLPGDISVKAYDAGGKGVCFVVTTKDGKTIFHGGDLNLWDMPDETDKREAEKDLQKYQNIVNRIAEEHPTLDVAMFDVDPRISLDFAQGARMFTEKIKVTDFFPMYTDGDIKAACDFNYLPATTKGHCLQSPGESINLH